ncbi:MAG: SHOCT domain-containing protein [Alphaproteobacteria bacterium]
MKNLLVLLVVLSFSACVIKDDSDIPVRKTAPKPVAKEEAKDKDAKSTSSDKLPESKTFKNATLVRLEELNKALDEGVITKDEYKKMRKQVLNESGLR